MDFTIEKYKELLETLKFSGYSFQTVSEFLEKPAEKSLILRHDVDARKQQSLKFARIQYKQGVKGTYYFRIVPESFDETVIREIEDMGHEIGYHYEDMDFADGDPEKAIKLFEEHLNKLRNVATVHTICMHGSPLSRYDNRDLWKFYDYRDFKIVGEPYFDIDFNRVFYLTDTGRRWDGSSVSMRDTVWMPDTSKYKVPVKTSEINELFTNRGFHTTDDIINSLKKGEFSDKVMMNFHPQRWSDSKILWIYELLTQKTKNVIKGVLKKLIQFLKM